MNIIGNETGLPNCCGLLAAAAYWYCQARGVPARVLNIQYGKDDGHAILIFQTSGSRLCTFDDQGSMIFTPDVSWDTPPTVLARTYAKVNKLEKKVRVGRWI